ncbi:MAG: hypothetical protein A7316_09440 [Candidatus Altiarchaeales archaeon WOR_SM1_86-2]|nr:MAG: hypothetical protein A7316_09440 [Candidatus Altiarchaeales archaeon WOR_SM1_86-2]
MTLEIVFWDVQHGSATYIKTPNGKHIVQDLGTGSCEKRYCVTTRNDGVIGVKLGNNPDGQQFIDVTID